MHSCEDKNYKYVARKGTLKAELRSYILEFPLIFALVLIVFCFLGFLYLKAFLSGGSIIHPSKLQECTELQKCIIQKNLKSVSQILQI